LGTTVIARAHQDIPEHPVQLANPLPNVIKGLKLLSLSECLSGEGLSSPRLALVGVASCQPTQRRAVFVTRGFLQMGEDLLKDSSSLGVVTGIE
jgi:hypothetical protein